MKQLTKTRTHYLKTRGKMIPLIDFCHCCLETMWRQEGGTGLRKEGWDLVWEITVSYSLSCKPSHTLGHCELEGTGLISAVVSRTHLFTHQQQRCSISEHLLYTATFPPFVAAVLPLNISWIIFLLEMTNWTSLFPFSRQCPLSQSMLLHYLVLASAGGPDG